MGANSLQLNTNRDSLPHKALRTQIRARITASAALRLWTTNNSDSGAHSQQLQQFEIAADPLP